MNLPLLPLKSGLKVCKVLPGPMEGVMTDIFCEAMHNLQLCHNWMTPYFRVTDQLPRTIILKKFLQPFTATRVPVIAQIMGGNSENMAIVAQQLLQLGAVGININFACPSNKVVKSGVGGALLAAPNTMLEIIAAVKNAIGQASLSVKLRSGFSNWREHEKILPFLSKNSDCDFWAIHFRTVKEMYASIDTDNRLERLQSIREHMGQQVLVDSGDIFSEADATAMFRLGYDGVMVARGMLQNPWLISDIIKSIIGNNSGQKQELAEAKTELFNALLTASWRLRGVPKKSKMLEYASMIWGKKTEQFQTLCKISSEDFSKLESI